MLKANIHCMFIAVNVIGLMFLNIENMSSTAWIGPTCSFGLESDLIRKEEQFHERIN